MNSSSLAEEWRAWLPIASGFGLSMICKMDAEEGETLVQRPPAFVFSYVWTILYLLLGYSWSSAANTKQLKLDQMHALCVFLLALWIRVYSCQKDKVTGIYIIAGTIATVVSCMCLDSYNTSSVVLVPLLAWLLVAFQLNWHVVGND